MPTIEESIEAALFARVATVSLTPALPISWPNVDFTAPASGRYATVQHLPNRNRRLFHKGSDPHQRLGILQLTVISPLHEGPTPATKAAGEIAEHFPADLALYSGGLEVSVTQAPDVAPAIKTDISWEVPVSVPYEVFA